MIIILAILLIPTTPATTGSLAHIRRFMLKFYVSTLQAWIHKISTSTALAFLFAAFPLEMGWCWQLPTYDGTKSYQNLLVEVYEMQTYNLWDGSWNNLDTALQVLPISLIHSGIYNYNYGIITNTGTGYYLESIPYNTTNVWYLHFLSAYLDPRTSLHKGYGYSLRCLVR